MFFVENQVLVVTLLICTSDMSESIIAICLIS